MLDIGTVLRHYKREDVREEMLRCARDREVAVKYGDKGFGRRPDTLLYPKDVLEFAKQGATSFHVSEEHWANVEHLSPELRRDELDRLRIGWDLVLDIDCKVWDYSKLTAHLLVQALKKHGVRSVSVKFSGNKGFHIGVPFQAFPTRLHEKETSLFFPEGAKRIAHYLAEFIRKPLAKEMLKMHSLQQMAELSGKEAGEILAGSRFNPFAIIEIDTLLISSRHLYRMPYSLHEKSGLCSVSINPDRIIAFDKEMARPENVTVSGYRFLDSENTRVNEARELIVQAFDFAIPEPKEEGMRTFEAPATAVPERLFPPCIANILKGLEDGRKRSMFILINFLSAVGYDYDTIGKILLDWNKRNKEPLREVLLKGQVRYRRHQKAKVLPPNCSNKAYYMDFRVCAPDNFCARIKNPVNYTLLKSRMLQEEKPKRERLTDEQKEMRRKYRESKKQII